MARFRGTVRGSRGEVSRLGHKGMRATVNGWEGGIRIVALPSGESELDLFEVRANGGSGGGFPEWLLGTLESGPNSAPRWIPAPAYGVQPAAQNVVGKGGMFVREKVAFRAELDAVLSNYKW